MNFEGNNKIIEKEKGISTGEITPRDRLQNQIRLATAVYGKLKGFIDLDSRKHRNEVMDFWGEEKFSDLYRDLEQDDKFKFHPRLGGHILKITADDMIYYKEHGELPE